MLAQKSTQNSPFIFDRRYRTLFNPDLFLLAYSHLSAKEGNMTQGVDERTLDGFNRAKVEEILSLLRSETSSPQPVRRAYVPKKNGTQRPRGIPTFMDKLVQEAIRLVLQAIYEPVFKKTSHGFRPGKSCHTALLPMKTPCKGTTWVIEGDIQGFCDNIDQAKLREILSRRIADGRLLNRINKFLTAGYMQFKQVQNSLSGTPQGGIVSPILANSSLHELDTFMEHLCEPDSTKRKRQLYQPYQTLSRQREAARKKGEHEQAEALLQKMRTMPSKDPFDQDSTQVKYTRYADDFVVMISGSKETAERRREQIRDFLMSELHLELSREKTLITNLTDQRIRFLGDERAQTRENTASTKETRGRKKRTANETIPLLVPSKVIREKLPPFPQRGKAIHHNARSNLPLLDLLTQYHAEVRGLYEDSCLATDVSTK